MYSWHEEWFDPVLKLHLAKLGAMVYVLEERGGRPLSCGHHRLFFINGELYGQTGSVREPVELSPSMYRTKE